MHFKWLTGLVLFFITLPAVSASSNLLVLGDSLSAAYGIPAESGWVNLLQARLKKQAYDYNVINASVSGETTYGGANRLPALLESHQPDIVILELGANDGLRALSIKQMQKNLSQIIQQSQAKGAIVLLLGMKLPPNYGIAYTRLFEKSFVRLKDQYDLPFIPFFLQDVALEPSLMQADKLHPNQAAQPLLLDTIWPTLSKIITLRETS